MRIAILPVVREKCTMHLKMRCLRMSKKIFIDLGMAVKILERLEQNPNKQKMY
ncbi:hypothetical protein ACH0B6_01855 [Solibacillus silvestris]